MTKQAKTASGGARGPRGAYAKTAEVRQKILDACVEAFGAGGFHGATMREIAKLAGISQTGLLHHFDSKAELLIEVLAAHERETSRIVREADDLDALQAQLQVTHANEARPGLIQLHSMIAGEATADDHPAHELYRARYDSLRLHLTRIFAELRGRGCLKVDTKPEILANLFVAVMDGLQIQWLYAPGAVDISTGLEAFIAGVVDDEARESPHGRDGSSASPNAKYESEFDI
ncbi:TetR/AcrR family transcriptional regulator [Streptomyces griseiscabiei]|uniref:TetR/AcrR family transcriptional regulator n=1 Tax=Streptomyces griseiscabiei TaxID=2993540 RepID=A0ABU4LG05_9ACTN|nr:TetR/AcrR family transcriptional regulator [Streptomyces griseiscabiei]MBZ3900370.1 TetR/AcrR family transcriptional regulator [Streptomyces griseiscabiei]MDX2914538.1 TetR/AcrR family transcriptional regulator [Streptomyces griseiscabiei]